MDNTNRYSVDNKKRRLIVMNFLTIFMVIFGLYFSMFGTLQPNIIEYYNLNLQQASLFIIVQNIGTTLSMIATALVVDRLNKNRLIGFMTLLMGLFLIIMGIAPLFIVLLAVWTIIGIFMSISNNTCSAYCSDLYGSDRSKYLAILHSFYGFGSLIGPTYAAWMLRRNKGWNGSYGYFGIIVLALGILFFATMFITKEPIPVVSNLDKHGKRKKISFRKLLGNKNMFALALMSFFVSGFQLFPSWIPTYLNRQDAIYYTLDRCSIIMTLYFIGMVLSRLSYSYLSKWLPPNKYVKYSSLISSGILLFTLLIQAPWLWYTCLFSLGLVSGALYTAQHSLACDEYPEYSASAMSIITLSTALGSILINSLIGYIAELGFFTVAMLVPVLAIAVAAIIISIGYTPITESKS